MGRNEGERRPYCCCVAIVILLLLLGGGGAGVFVLLRNRVDGGSEGEQEQDAAKVFGDGSVGETEESSEMVGANSEIMSQKIVRENRFYGLSYSPFGLGDNKLCPPFDDVGKQCLLTNQVEADVRLISTMTNRVKTYSLLCEASMDALLAYCEKEGIEVMLGVWVGKSEKENEAELARLDAVLEKYGKSDVITSVMVGNEAVFVLGVEIDDLADMIEEVRKRLKSAGNKASVGTAEIYNVWTGTKTENIPNDEYEVKEGLDMGKVVDAVDWIGLNAHAYYGTVDPKTGDSGKYVLDERVAVSKHWNGKPVWVTETGYPTRGKKRTSEVGTATPGVGKLELFAAQIEDASREHDMPVFFFEPFDGDWKRRWNPFTQADYSWGLYNCDRTLKKLDLPEPGAL